MTHDEKIVEAVATAEVRYDGYEDLLCLSRTMRERYLDRARAAITAFQAEAWQPIETFDGSEAYALVWDGHDVSEARYHPNEDGWWLANTHPTDAQDGEVYPSYWMPKPSPPAPNPPASP